MRREWLIVCGSAWILAVYLLLGKAPRDGPVTVNPQQGAASSSSNSNPGPTKSAGAPDHMYQAFAFEVHGRVQGVFFRKFTVAKAQALHLVGWCANTQRGTVVGECQGKPQALEEMKEWLCTEGSPHSHIDHCDFKHERSIDQLEFQVFERRPNVP